MNSNCLAGFIDFQIIMTPSPALPLKEKGDQPHKPQLRLVRWHSLRQLTEELEGIFDNNHFEDS